MTDVVGREEELARAEEFLDFGKAQPRVLLFEGEPGIGKTTLWRAGVERARELEMRVLETRPAEAERELSYAGLGDLLDGMYDEIGNLPGPQRRALRIALLIEEPKGEPPEQRAIGAAVRGLFRLLAGDGPVVVAVDDLQWLDLASTAALRFALRRLDGRPLRMLAASRPDSNVDVDDLERVSLEPLEPGALDELVRARLGVQLLRPTLRQLEEASGGNPFYALEIAAALVRSERRLAPGDPLPIPSSLRDLVRARLETLSSSARDAALATAALAQPTSAGIDRALGRQGAVREAVSARILETDGGGVRFVHPLLATVLYEDASSDEKRAIHHRVAATIEDVEQRARLLAAVAEEPDDELASVLEKAAESAAARGAADSGATLARQALNMTPETRLDDAHRRRLLVARLTSAAGDPKHAEELLEQQLARSDEGHARAEVSFELGNVRLTMRGNSAARYCYENALAELGDADEHDELRLRILLELAIAHSGELRHESDVSERAIALAEKLGRPDLLARALGTHAMTPRLLGEPPDDAYWRRALRVERESGELRYGGPTHAYALHVFIQDDYETGAQHLQRLMESMRARADPKLTWVLQDLSDVARASGAWNVGSKLADEAYEYALQTGQESLEPQCLMYTARFALLRGDQGADHSSDGASPAA